MKLSGCISRPTEATAFCKKFSNANVAPSSIKHSPGARLNSNRVYRCSGARPRSTVGLHYALITGISSTPATAAAATQTAEPEESSTLGVVIVDHGSKRKASNDMLLEFVNMYKQVSGRSNVQPAHMEIAEPSISQAVAACISCGASTVIVAPYFLSKGRHIQDDIPALVSEAQQLYPHVKCVVAAPIGVDPMMAKLIESRVKSAASKIEN